MGGASNVHIVPNCGLYPAVAGFAVAAGEDAGEMAPVLAATDGVHAPLKATAAMSR
jgi:hypothetical protein